MSMRGLDSWITGDDGSAYWQGHDENEDSPHLARTFICGFCRAAACPNCVSVRCDCPYRCSPECPSHEYGHSHKHARKLELVRDMPDKFIWDDPDWDDESERDVEEAGPQGDADASISDPAAGGSDGPITEAELEELKSIRGRLVKLGMGEDYLDVLSSCGVGPLDLKRMKRGQYEACMTKLREKCPC